MSRLADRFLEKGILALRDKEHEQALGFLQEALKCDPDLYEAWIIRGTILGKRGQDFEGMLHFERALAIRPDGADALNNMALSFANMGMFDEAMKCFSRSIDIVDTVDPHLGIAGIYCTHVQLEEAEREYETATRMEPDHYPAHINLGVTRLGLGKWDAKTWSHYGKRWQHTPYPSRVRRQYPTWNGEDLNDKTIVLYPEQGYGDEVMALRMVTYLRDRYPSVNVIVQARVGMLRLAQQIAPAFAPGDEFPEADYGCPLLDAIGVTGATPQTLSMGPYLKAPRRPEFIKRIEDLPYGLNIGLCWKAGSHFKPAREGQAAKSIPPKLLIHHLRGLDVNWISLQKPRGEDGVYEELNVIDWADDLEDFYDTASLMRELDLVVSVDTAVAHLAGALGVKCWNLVRYSGYWPWLRATKEQPQNTFWYPSMRLYRQLSLTDWATPLAEIRKDLECLATSVAS